MICVMTSVKSSNSKMCQWFMYQYHLRPPFPLDLDVTTEFEVKNCTGFYEASTLFWNTKLCHAPTSKKDCCLATSSITNVFGLICRIFRRLPLTVENPGLGATLALGKVLVLALLAHYISPNVKYLTVKKWKWKHSINVPCIVLLGCK